MQAFLAILLYDLRQLGRSWLVPGWIGLLALVALAFAALGAGGIGIPGVESPGRDLASETVASYIALWLAPISGIFVAILAAAAVSGEVPVIADSILSRSVTRMEYMSAKIVARLGVTLGIYFAVMLPFTYVVVRYATPDTSAGGIVVGLLMVASLLVFLAALGITLSALVHNVLMAVVLLLLGIVSSGFVLQFVGLTWMSATAVIHELPATFRGETPVWDEVRVLSIFLALTAAAISSSLWLFRRKDL